ncbi:hypothetical protein Tco_1390396, partial [Tanacetum coccineum]
MSSPKFAKTHNVVAFLEKLAESDGFAEIIVFLKISYVHYALTVNLIIYISCIQQFWATENVKMVNEVRQLQALIDKKKMIITKSSIRSDLHLEDAEDIDCLPTTTIFELAKMGLSAKSTAWNEFSSTMVSLIICLATNQKFNLSKYIFNDMVKHLDGGVKFLLYPRFLQVFINQQVGDMSHHKEIYVNPSHTKKFFANMKRAGTDFFGRITPLFDTMMLQASEESKRKQRKEAEVTHDEAEHEESVPTPSNDPQPSGKDSMQLNDLMVLCTQLQKQVLDLEKAKSDQDIEIASLKKRVDKLEKRRKFKTARLKRLKKVSTARRIESSNDSLGSQEDASKQGRRIEDIDTDAEVTLVNETQERQDEDLMFDTGVLDDDEVFVDVTTVEKEEQSTKTGEAVTTAGVEDSVTPTIPITAGVEDSVVLTIPTTVYKPTVSVTQSSIKDKGKGIVQEPERPLTKKDQVALDEDLVRNIQAQLYAEIIEEERLERKKQEEANIALIESWENTQAMMEADILLAERLQTREREELTDEEKGKLFMELLEKRRRHFAALRAQEKRNRPPTKAQKRSQMSTY